jgi:hypothetical protein
VVNDMKLAETKGRVALHVGSGTDSHFLSSDCKEGMDQ